MLDVCSGQDYKHLSNGTISVYGTGGYMLSVDKALSYKNDAIGIGRKGTIDKPYILNAPFWTVDTLFYAIPKKQNNLYFLFCEIQKTDWKSKDESTGVPSLSKTTINAVEFATPEYDEQTKIGEFFKNLDNLITKNQKKYDKLVNMKKACLDKMFPKDEVDTPEVRFKGFSGKWAQREFADDIVTIQTGTNKLGNIINKGTPLLKMGNIQRGYFNLDKLEYLSEKEVIEVDNIVRNGDFLLNTRNTLDLVGKGATWTGEDLKYAFNSNIARIVLSNVGTLFFNYLYNTNEMISQVHERATGTTSVAAIYPTNLNSLKYYIPQLDEQTKIGTLFQTLDKLIALRKTELEKLKKIKKACLDKMFI